MFRQLSERLHESLDGRFQLRADNTLAGVVVPFSSWSVWMKQADGSFKQVCSAPTVALLAQAVKRASGDA
jgi:hypothetical protein